MKCLKNLSSTLYNADLVKNITKLYTYKGKDFYYEVMLKQYINGIVNETIEKETDYASRLLNIKVTEARKQRIIKHNAEPKTKDEQLLYNLKTIFVLISKKGKNMDIDDNEFLQLAKRIFDKVEDISYASYDVLEQNNTLYPEKKRKFKRDEMIEALKQFKIATVNQNIEVIGAITAFYVDLLHMNCYTSHNEFMALIIMYALIVKSGFNLFKYESFFEAYYKNVKDFKVVTASASLNWETGFANTTMLQIEVIKLMLSCYNKIDLMLSDYKFDKSIRKIDNVESAIMKLPQTFTRKDIKEACPRLSDSTINRALEELKDEGKIRSNGTGRSATWMKLVENESFQSKIKQMSIDDIVD